MRWAFIWEKKGLSSVSGVEGIMMTPRCYARTTSAEGGFWESLCAMWGSRATMKKGKLLSGAFYICDSGCRIPLHHGKHLWVITQSSCSHVQLFATPWTAAHQASLSITNFWILLKLMSIRSVITGAWKKKKPRKHKINTSLPKLLSPTKQKLQSFGLQEFFLCLKSGRGFLNSDQQRVCGQQSNTQENHQQQHSIEARWECWREGNCWVWSKHLVKIHVTISCTMRFI